MRLFPLTRPVTRYAIGVASCAYALTAVFSIVGHAGQARSITERVYSAAQSARGQQVYQTQCAGCHGNMMEGTTGPPLAGDSFLSNWSARSLANLVDKIQKTMPFDQPGSLSRQQSIALGAYILQAGKFPSGSAELTDSALAQIAFPAARTTAAPAVASSTGATLPPPEGNLAELMRAIAFPNANIIFNVQL